MGFSLNLMGFVGLWINFWVLFMKINTLTPSIETSIVTEALLNNGAIYFLLWFIGYWVLAY